MRINTLKHTIKHIVVISISLFTYCTSGLTTKNSHRFYNFFKLIFPLNKTKKNTAKNKMSDSEIKKKLTPLQYKITQRNGTEPPFKNKYWDNKQEGIYVDIVSGKPLFSSLDKYDSKTGWPTFSQSLVEKNISTHRDNSLFMSRTEVRSENSHLGHIFNDKNSPTHKRFCINSAALQFIPVNQLDEKGYSQFKNLFIKK